MYHALGQRPHIRHVGAGNVYRREKRVLSRRPRHPGRLRRGEARNVRGGGRLDEGGQGGRQERHNPRAVRQQVRRGARQGMTGRRGYRALYDGSKELAA